MKLILTILSFLSAASAFATIDTGTYKVEKIQCAKSGKQLKLGGKFITYSIILEVGDTSMKMTAVAKAGDWAPFKLDCTQVNEGTFAYTQENKYEGELPNKSAVCTPDLWTSFLKKRLFGVEEYGEFTYSMEGQSLTISNPKTVTKYSCDGAGDYPVYYYKKI